MPRTTKHVKLVDLDFDNLKGLSDDALFKHFRYVCGLSKQIVVPKNLNINAFRVSRGTNHLTLHLLRSGRKDDPGTEVFRFSFLPGPRFT